MTTYQAKLDEEREADAHAKGMSLWQYDMSRAVDDKLCRDLMSDQRRNAATAFPLHHASVDETNRSVARRDEIFTPQVVAVIVMSGGSPGCTNEAAALAVRRMLDEGLSEGAAAARLHRQFPNL